MTPKDGGTGFVTKTISIQDPKPIKDVKATPAALTINDGQSYKPVILTTYKDGSTSESASLYSWVSANTSVATCTLSSGQLTITAMAVNSPGSFSFSHDGYSSNLSNVKPLPIIELIISLMVYFL